MGKITILPETTKNPVTLIGRRAGILGIQGTVFGFVPGAKRIFGGVGMGGGAPFYAEM